MSKATKATIDYKDLETSDLVERLAEWPDSDIQYELGSRLITQNDKISQKSAVIWFHEAASNGHHDAQNSLGICYRDGIGVEVSPEEAFKCFYEAASNGHHDAQNSLGICYRKGFGTQRSNPECARWLAQAVLNGNVEAHLNIGICYEQGIGLNKDREEAIKYYEIAATRGNIQAQNKLGICLMNKSHDTQDVRKFGQLQQAAFNCFLEAARAGNVDAQNSLGVCYKEGLGTEKNLNTAIEWFSAALDSGSAYAEQNLKVCSQEMRGAATDSLQVSYKLSKDLAIPEPEFAPQRANSFLHNGGHQI